MGTFVFLGVIRICTVINRPMLVGRFSDADLVPRSSLHMPPVPTVYNGLYLFLVQIRFLASFCKIYISHVYVLLSNHYLHRHQPAHAGWSFLWCTSGSSQQSSYPPGANVNGHHLFLRQIRFLKSFCNFFFHVRILGSNP